MYAKKETRGCFEMKVIVCVDDKNGMMFHRRRQSRDRVVAEDMIRSTRGKKIRMNAYSAKLFAGLEDAVEVEEDFLETAEKEDVCFVEDVPLLPFEKKISQLILYHWNRVYPADVFFDLPLTEWELESREEFPGNSHEKITKETWKKK
jgi:hypothetical protein